MSCRGFPACYFFAVNTSFPRLAAAFLLLTAPAILAQSPPGELILSEDFEGTKVGEIPQGFTKTGAVAVVEDAAHGGKRSLRIEAAKNGARRITSRGRRSRRWAGSIGDGFISK